MLVRTGDARAYRPPSLPVDITWLSDGALFQRPDDVSDDFSSRLQLQSVVCVNVIGLIVDGLYRCIVDLAGGLSGALVCWICVCHTRLTTQLRTACAERAAGDDPET